MTLKGYVPLAGTTAKVQHWVARITKASCAHNVLVMNANGYRVTLASLKDSSTFSEENTMVVEQVADYPSPEQGRDVSRETDKFHVDASLHSEKLWEEFVMRSRRYIEDKKWTDAYKKLIWQASKGRPLYFHGAEAATYTKDGKFTESVFAKNYPDLVTEYTRFVTEKKLDVEALKADHPDIFEDCRAPTLRPKNNPVVPE